MLSAELPKSDIRNFGVRGRRMTESSKTVRNRLQQKVNVLRSKRSRNSVLPDICDRLEASRILDQIDNGQSVLLPGKNTKKITEKFPKVLGYFYSGSRCQKFISLS